MKPSLGTGMSVLGRSMLFLGSFHVASCCLCNGGRVVQSQGEVVDAHEGCVADA